MVAGPELSLRALFSAAEISARVHELADAMASDHGEADEVLLVGVLKGAFVFLSDLVRSLRIPVTVDFIAVSSYGASTESSGVVRIVKDLDQSIWGKHVILVEDIVDTGLTLQYLIRHLAAREPASLRVCALLDKPGRRQIAVPVHYRGFAIGDDFVVGYGLDHAERYRNLPYIAVLEHRHRPQGVGSTGTGCR